MHSPKYRSWFDASSNTFCFIGYGFLDCWSDFFSTLLQQQIYRNQQPISVVVPEQRLADLLDAQVDASGAPLNDHLREFITDLAADPRGFPLRVYQFDTSEHLARARVVHNMVEIDPDVYISAFNKVSALFSCSIRFSIFFLCRFLSMTTGNSSMLTGFTI